jgi:ribosomal protein S18 acetylase RimI-like enzyme
MTRFDPLQTYINDTYMKVMTKPNDFPLTFSFKVRRLDARDIVDYRDLRLEGLKFHPEAFASSWEHEVDKPTSWWAERLKISTVFGGWVNSSPLVGMAGFRVQDGTKLQHKGVLWGMYVRPQARGSGLAATLVNQVIEHARPLVEDISLTVVASNVAARRLYGAAGFEEYGFERRALKVGTEYYDEVLMTLPLKHCTESAPTD